jgi:hypothetical protein
VQWPCRVWVPVVDPAAVIVCCHRQLHCMVRPAAQQRSSWRDAATVHLIVHGKRPGSTAAEQLAGCSRSALKVVCRKHTGSTAAEQLAGCSRSALKVVRRKHTGSAAAGGMQQQCTII